MKNYQKSLGNLGEKIAKKYLQQKKYQIIKVNFTIQGGQIDLITNQKSISNKIIFFEIKTRTNSNFGQAEELISLHQKQTLLHAAQIYLAKNGLFHCSWQFDLISINLNMKTFPPIAKIRHLTDIFAE